MRDRILAAIATGQFVVGTRLPDERSFASQLAIGRTTLRAALRELHDEGLIVTTRGRSGGSFVRASWSTRSAAAVIAHVGDRWAETKDRIDAMSRIRGCVAGAAAEQRDETDLQGLHNWAQRFEHACSDRGRRDADAQLHLALAVAAKNDTLFQLQTSADRAVTLGAPAHIWGLADEGSSVVHRVSAYHRRLLAAVDARDGSAAELIAREHCLLAAELLRAAVARADAVVAAALSPAEPVAR